MATITVRFRGICCFIDPTKGDGFEKRVVLPNMGSHEHSTMEEHLPIIEYLADDLRSAPSELERVPFSRPGDEGKYEYIKLTEPVCIEFLGISAGKVTKGINLEDSTVHLDELVGQTQLKNTLLGPAAKVKASLATAVMDLPAGVLMAGPPDSMPTEFEARAHFRKRRVARWFDHIAELDSTFGLQLTPLNDPQANPQLIWFKPSVGLITIAQEPERLIVGHFVEPRLTGKNTAAHADHPAATPPRATGHFDVYWDLVSDPPFRPVPLPFQGTGPGCAPATKP
jgi:hypothetical protein